MNVATRLSSSKSGQFIAWIVRGRPLSRRDWMIVARQFIAWNRSYQDSVP
jgi:hypothetical protein